VSGDVSAVARPRRTKEKKESFPSAIAAILNRSIAHYQATKQQRRKELFAPSAGRVAILRLDV
jgi:hypothetical protein